MERKITKLCRKLKNELDEERYTHTLGVMYTSAALAMCHGADLNQALLAGLLHDCAKCISGNKKIKLCKKYHLGISEAERENPSLLHAKLGAFLAAKKYHVKDPEVLDAIASHTTGRPGMSLLEKIVYIADYIEPGREELPNMEAVRKMAFDDIDECMYRMVKDSLAYLRTREIPIDTMTEKTYHYYRKKLRKEEDEE